MATEFSSSPFPALPPRARIRARARLAGRSLGKGWNRLAGRSLGEGWNRNRSTLALICHLFLFAFLTSSAFSAPTAILDSLIPGGPSGQARTLDGESIWLDQIRFSTPRDLDKLEPDEIGYRFDTTPNAPDFETVEELTFENLADELIGSKPEEMETYRLGNARMAVPPPPDWKRSYHQIPPWAKAVAVSQVDSLPFVNGAVFCWTAGAQAPAGSARVYLFRQAFNVQQHDKIARATLRLATNGEPLEISLNEHPLQLAGKGGFRLATYEVTQLLQPGTNLLAVKVSERPRSTEPNYGIAFHVEIQRRAKAEPPPPIKPTEALLTSKGGDRVWGVIHDVNADGISLDGAYGRYRLAWEECGALIFPNGWRPAEPEEHKTKEPVTAQLPLYGLPLAMAPQPLQDCLILTENRRTTARPGYARGGQLFFESGEGKQFSLPTNEVLGIYPPQPLEWSYRRPRPESALIYCRLITTRGEQITGQLRQLRGSSAVLETDSGNFLELKTRWISSIYFPYHGASAIAPKQSTAPKIALMPLATGSEAYRVAYQNDIRRVQAAAFTIGAETANLSMDDAAQPAQLNIGHYPVAVYVDPTGEYLHTMNAPGDAQQALIEYLNQGGRLIVLARGGAFRTIVRNENGQMKRTPAEMTSPNLADELGVRMLRPASTGGAVEPFNHPPNNGRTMLFQRASQMPSGLLGLERRLPLGSILSAPFYPMVATGSGAIPLYDLADDSGKVYGPAAQLIHKGRGSVIIIDHLLWESEINDIPFSTRELPKLLRWSLTAN